MVQNLLSSSTGQVYSLGRAEYGRLGLGKDAGEKSEPAAVTGISDVQVVACGASVSYAVTKQGEAAPCPGSFTFHFTMISDHFNPKQFVFGFGFILTNLKYFSHYRFFC